MKKAYISPELQCIKIATVGMLAVSQGLNGASDYTGGGTLSGAPAFDWDED